MSYQDESYQDEDADWEDPDFDDIEEPEDSGTIECPNCGAAVYEDSPQCPTCGEYVTRSRPSPFSGKPVWYVVLAILGGLAVVFACLRF
ncbi:hypothetical protein [Planctomicrobium sp. SH664]|uniref:hypothetical protein n=1 Tax=Planctomicrobium sp. SH664 TaxID=3448125 RepID=UPI003F5C796C